MRIDLWLKYVCLVKHRADATDACKGGHVKLNGQRVKPAATVREGDAIEIVLGERFRRVIVSVIPATQAAKELARTMYVDETPVREKVDVIFRERGAGRPTKKERRRWSGCAADYAFTNLRISTFSISPMAMKNIIVDEPPYEISGRGIPVVGRTPICIDTLISTWKMKNEIRQMARNVPPRSRAFFANVSACRIRKR